MRATNMAMLQRTRMRNVLLALGPVMGAAVGAMINLLTSHWNWWLFGILTILVGAAAVIAVRLGVQTSSPAKPDERASVMNDDDPPLRQRNKAVNTLPRDVDDFTGREEAISRLMGIIEASPEHAVNRIAVHSIEGIGGVGKTALVVHIAHQIAGRYKDAVLYIDLRAHDNTQKPVSTYDALGILLSGLGIPGKRIPEQLEARTSLWRRELADARALIILDNASSPEQLKDMLVGGAHCLILITSRQRLFELEGVSSVPLDTLSPDEAVALFNQVVGTEQCIAQQAEVAGIVRRLGYLPLAVRLAAALLRSHPAWTVRDLQEIDFSQDTTLKSVYTRCYRDLSPRLKKFFRLLSVHPGSEITAEAAAVLADTTVPHARRMLGELYNRYLIEEPLPHRFKFHDLIKEFIYREAKGMSNDFQGRDALPRLLAYYVFMASGASPSIGMHDLFAVSAPANGHAIRPPQDEASALRWFDDELGNLLACAYYANDASLMPFAWQLPASMTSYLRLRGFTSQAMSILDTALHTLTVLPDRSGEAIIRRRIGHLARLQANYELSRNQLDRSLQLTAELDDRQGLAWCHHELGHLDRATRHLTAARDHFEKALAINRELGYKAGEAAAETNLAIVLLTRREPEDTADTRDDDTAHTRDTDAAREYLQQALSIATASSDRRAQAFALYHLGALERDIGEHATARGLLTKALDIYDKTGNRHGQADCYFHLGQVDRLTGDYETSKQHLNQALRIYVELEYRREEADTHIQLAATAEAAHEEALALVHRQRAKALYAEMGIEPG